MPYRDRDVPKASPRALVAAALLLLGCEGGTPPPAGPEGGVVDARGADAGTLAEDAGTLPCAGAGCTAMPAVPDASAAMPDGGDAGEEVCGMPGERAQPNGFAVMYPRCTRYRGHIHAPDVSRASEMLQLRSLRQIDEGFSIFRSHGLSDLRGLEALQKIGGEFSVSSTSLGGTIDTANLVSLAGLDALTEVGALTLDGNRRLSDLSGLSRLRLVRGNVRITGNGALPKAQIDALLARIEVKGTITVSGNAP